MKQAPTAEFEEFLRANRGKAFMIVPEEILELPCGCKRSHGEPSFILNQTLSGCLMHVECECLWPRVDEGIF